MSLDNGTNPDGTPHEHSTFPEDHPVLFPVIRENIIQALIKLRVSVDDTEVNIKVNDLAARLVRLTREAYIAHGHRD